MHIPPSEILEQLEYEDASEEIACLITIKDAVADYLTGLDDKGFAAEYGGRDALLMEMRKALNDYELEFGEE